MNLARAKAGKFEAEMGSPEIKHTLIKKHHLLNEILKN